MYELCALLRATTPRAPKEPSKPRAKAIRVGVRVVVRHFGVHQGTVVRRHETDGGCWYVEIDGHEGRPIPWFRRHLITVL